VWAEAVFQRQFLAPKESFGQRFAD